MTSLADRFAELGPWVTQFQIGGETLGGTYDASSDRRFDAFRKKFPTPARVLELGCLEGGHTRLLAESAEHVVAIDSRPDNIERARFVHEFLGITNTTFMLADLETFPLDSLGRFDVIFNVGLLYHLPQPWKLLEQLAPLGQRMFLWTHFAPKAWRNVRRGGYRGAVYKEGGVRDPLSGMSDTSFWPIQSELLHMLEKTGFADVDILNVEANHPHGPAILLACRSRVFTKNAEISLPQGATP